MRIFAILACVAVTACASGPDLTAVQSGCGYQTKPFVAAWPCVRTGVAKATADGDLKDVYIASGDFVSEQVTDGKMTDAEAKLAMAQVRQRARDTADARGATPTGDAIVMSSILNRQAPAYQAPAYSTPGGRVSCWRLGNNVQCY